jgi:DNA replication protein DnaC
MSKQPQALLLEHHLKALKLPSLLRDYAAVAATCQQERGDYATFLLRLVERELIDRERRAAERRVRDAQFQTVKTLDTFEFAAQPAINEALVRELSRGHYIEKKENVLLVGNPGTGKTHLATALGFAACGQGKRVRFTTATGLVTQLLEAQDGRCLQRLTLKLQRLDLLILDELGYVPFSKTGAELLFDVVSHAYERGSVIVTTNLPFEKWTEIMGSERLTGALLDRLTHRVHILEANGESYRFRDAQKKLKNKNDPILAAAQTRTMGTPSFPLLKTFTRARSREVGAEMRRGPPHPEKQSLTNALQPVLSNNLRSGAPPHALELKPRTEEPTMNHLPPA